jgi:hypothetical protein
MPGVLGLPDAVHHSLPPGWPRLDALWAVSGWGEPVDRFLRDKLRERPSTARGLVQRRALLLWGDPAPVPSAGEAAQVGAAYDVVYYRTEAEGRALGGVVRPLGLQHAFGLDLGLALVEGQGPGRAGAGAPLVLRSSGEVSSLAPDGVPEVLGHLGPRDRHGSDPAALLRALAEAPTVVFGDAPRPPELWLMVGAAVALRNVTPHVQVWSHDARALEVIHGWPSGWDGEYYAHQLAMGMTRAMCLGECVLRAGS